MCFIHNWTLGFKRWGLTSRTADCSLMKLATATEHTLACLCGLIPGKPGGIRPVKLPSTVVSTDLRGKKRHWSELEKDVPPNHSWQTNLLVIGPTSLVTSALHRFVTSKIIKYSIHVKPFRNEWNIVPPVTVPPADSPVTMPWVPLLCFRRSAACGRVDFQVGTSST